MDHRSLGEFVAFLRQAEIHPRPDGEDWQAMIARIHVTGTIQEIKVAAGDMVESEAVVALIE